MKYGFPIKYSVFPTLLYFRYCLQSCSGDNCEREKNREEFLVTFFIDIPTLSIRLCYFPFYCWNSWKNIIFQEKVLHNLLHSLSGYWVQMCSKVLQPSSLVVLFETLLSSAATTVDDDKGNPSWQARADFYITCILSCLPWGGGELVEVKLLSLIGNFNFVFDRH